MDGGWVGNDGFERTQRSLADTGGVVVRQQTQAGEMIAQAVGVPWEKSNKYVVHRLPSGKTVKQNPGDSDGWSPTEKELRSLEPFMRAQEESGCLTRLVMTYFGCGSLRPLKLHFTLDGEDGDVYVIDRPFKYGGHLCSPLEMKLGAIGSRKTDLIHIGRVRESFSPYLSRCCSVCCLSTTYTDIERLTPDGSYEKRYTVRVNRSCCGRVNNCCAPSVCRSDAVYDVLDPDGEIAATLQASFGRGCSCATLFRSGGGYNNFVLEFPKDSTPHDRALLLASVFQIDFQHFER